jgi:hypothetical protein
MHASIASQPKRAAVRASWSRAVSGVVLLTVVTVGGSVGFFALVTSPGQTVAKDQTAAQAFD